MNVEVPQPHQCTDCGATRTKPAAPRIPNGWKRRGDVLYCLECWTKHYVLRAITFPIASPLNCDWRELDLRLRDMWAATTQACNWMMTELFARDVRRTDEPKMPPMQHVYLYPEVRRRFPKLPSQTVAALEKAVTAKYRAKRYEVIWTCSASLPTYRYPTPFPMPNQGWHAEFEGEAPAVSMRIGDERIRLRLKGGPRFARMRRAFQQVVSNEAHQGEAAIYRSGNNTMVKLVAWLPRAAAISMKGAGVLRVRTDPNSFIVALNEKEERIWAIHADHIPRWSAEHRHQLQRWSDDSKVEFGPTPPFAHRRTAAAQKYRDRMNSACHQVSAQVANYAARRRFAVVRFNDHDRSFCEGFPWANLRNMLAYKLDAHGIQLELVNAEAVQEPNSSAAAE